MDYDTFEDKSYDDDEMIFGEIKFENERRHDYEKMIIEKGASNDDGTKQKSDNNDGTKQKSDNVVNGVTKGNSDDDLKKKKTGCGQARGPCRQTATICETLLSCRKHVSPICRHGPACGHCI